MTVLLLLLLLPSLSLCMSPEEEEQLFGSGLSEGVLAAESRRHLSSSVEDLALLFGAERAAAAKLKRMPEAERSKATEAFLASLDYDPLSDTPSPISYASHPVNAYHLLQRASGLVAKLSEEIPATLSPEEAPEDLRLLSGLALPDRDFSGGATFGLLNLQTFHDLDPSDVIGGLVTDPSSGASFRSASNLSCSDAARVAQRAKDVWRLDSHVRWAEAAAEVERGVGKKRRKRLRKEAKEAREFHDEFIMLHGFMEVLPSKIDSEMTVVFTERAPFDHKLTRNNPTYARNKALRDTQEYSTRMFENLDREGDAVPFNLAYFLRPMSKRLCRGEGGEDVRPPEMDAGLKCLWLHWGNPYLRIGPMKYEVLNSLPHVGTFRSFASRAECGRIRARARGRTKATPLMVQNSNSAYTSLRTSKVMYLGESADETARKLSDRIDAATRLKVHGEKYASENYQVMNYGIGGSITGHLDSVGEVRGDGDDAAAAKAGGTKKSESEGQEKGGERLVTFMIYLTDVDAGGRTIFPQLGLSASPVEGDALFWFNLDSSSRYDTRNYHMGCPVLHGNKWIANKWIKTRAQMWRYPCLIDRGPYRPFANPS